MGVDGVGGDRGGHIVGAGGVGAGDVEGGGSGQEGGEVEAAFEAGDGWGAEEGGAEGRLRDGEVFDGDFDRELEGFGVRVGRGLWGVEVGFGQAGEG